MTDLAFYGKLGWQHIMSWDAIDHLLFLLALSATYVLCQWKQVLVLVTAFTIGHSLTLALSIFNVVKVSDKLVEFLIPCTIIISSFFNLILKNKNSRLRLPQYTLAMFFGLIHGLAFANTLRFILPIGGSLGWALLGFNIGLEVAQIIIISTILFCNYLIIRLLKIQPSYWVWSISMFTILFAIYLAWQRI